MIGKVIIGRSFGGVVRYVMEKGNADILDQSGVRRESSAMIVQDFNAIRQLRPGLKNAVWHTSISFAHDDRLTGEKMTMIARDYLAQIGLGDHQYLVVRHYDTKHQHMHIISNRVGYDGQVASDRFCRNRTARACDLLEQKYRLVVAREQGRNGGMINDKAPVKKQVKNTIRNTLFEMIRTGVSDLDRLGEELRTRGIELHLQVQKTGRVNGVSFRHQGLEFKGSAIDRAFSIGRLLGRLARNTHHDQDQENDERRKN